MDKNAKEDKPMALFGCCSYRQSLKAGRVFKAAHFTQRDLVAPVVGTPHGVTRCLSPLPHIHTPSVNIQRPCTYYFFIFFSDRELIKCSKVISLKYVILYFRNKYFHQVVGFALSLLSDIAS